MPSKKYLTTASHRHNKPSGQAVVTLIGRDYYLGTHGTKTSRVEYDRIMAEWLANGCRLRPVGGTSADTIIEVTTRFWQQVKTCYISDGRPTSEVASFKHALGS